MKGLKKGGFASPSWSAGCLRAACGGGGHCLAGVTVCLAKTTVGFRERRVNLEAENRQEVDRKIRSELLEAAMKFFFMVSKINIFHLHV